MVYDHLKMIYIIELIRSRNVKLFYFLMKNLRSFARWDELANATLKYTIQFGGIWHLWGHSWEIEKYSNWKKLIKIFEKIKEVAETRNISLMDNSQLISKFSCTREHLN